MGHCRLHVWQIRKCCAELLSREPAIAGWQPSARKRKIGAGRHCGEKTVECGDIHALLRPCLRREKSVELVDFLIRKQRIQHPSDHLQQRRAPVPLRSCHCYRGCAKPARWRVDRTKLVPTTYRPRVWTTADQVRPVIRKNYWRGLIRSKFRPNCEVEHRQQRTSVNMK